jgi:tetratricopeptide (TPR) repeat protein
MGFKEITNLRKAGKLDEALRVALEEHSQAPNDTYITRALAWVYYAMLKLMNASQFRDFKDKFYNLLQLGIDLSNEEYLLPSLQWIVNSMGWNLIKTNRKVRQNLRQLLELAINMPATKTTANSVVVKMFVKAFKKDKFAYFGLVDWQGFDNFLRTQKQDDYKSEKYNGKEMISLVESYVTTYCKHLLPEEYNGQILFERERVEQFMPYFSQLIETHPEYKWFPYYKARLQNTLGDRKAALQTIIPFVRLHRNDFWAWSQLGDFLESADEKLSCYCRGIQCNSKAKILIRLRKKLIPFFLEFSEYGAAKYELDQILQICKKK